MITSLPKRIIKPGMGVEIEQFIPPVRTDEQSVKPARMEFLDGKPDGSLAAADAVERAEDEAGQIIQKANQLAGDILREAGIQAEKLKKTAIAEGYQEGYEQGIRDGRHQAEKEQRIFEQQLQEEIRKDVEQALESVERAKETCMRTYLDELKECSVAIAEKVVHISLKSSGEIIKRMLIAETEKLKKRAWVKIYIEKTDYDMMTEADADVVNELAKLSDNIKFVVMDKGNSGSCILEMPDEIVDISVDTQMENIREILENIRF